MRANIPERVRPLYWVTTSSSACLCFQGQCFVAINPDNFALGFNERMSDLMSIQRGMEPVSLHVGW